MIRTVFTVLALFSVSLVAACDLGGSNVQRSAASFQPAPVWSTGSYR